MRIPYFMRHCRVETITLVCTEFIASEVWTFLRYFQHAKSQFETRKFLSRIQDGREISAIIVFNFSVALEPRRAKTDWNGCCQTAVQGALWLAKRFSLNLNFSFLNRISLLLISSSYPIVLTRLGGPRSRPYTSRKFLGYSRETNPGPLGW